MRKSACLLAILGIGVSGASVHAQEAFGPTAQKQNAETKPSLKFFNAQSSGTTPSTGLVPASSPAPVQSSAPAQIPNYYSDLFAVGEEAQPTSTATLKPVLVPANVTPPALQAAQPSAIQQADFQLEDATTGGVIQMVGGEAEEIRPFPALPAEDLTPSQDVAPQPPASEENTAAPSVDSAPKSTGTLTITRIPSQRDRIAPGAMAPVAPEAVNAPTIVTTKEFQGPQTPTVTIEWKKKSEINVGQQFDCDLIVKNTGLTVATNVEVDAHLPENVRVLETVPAPTHSETFLSWQFAELQPGQQEVIRVSMLPFQRGQIAAQANVRFTGAASGVFEVAEPLLALSMKGPHEVMVGENIPQTIVVSNPGTGVASNIKIEAVIPKGLQHVRGERLLMEIGSLNPGESRNVRLAMAATDGGEHQLVVHAVADNGLNQETTTTVNVIAPVLSAAVEGPKLRYLGREGVYKLIVKNDGLAATNNVQLMHKVPDGFRFVKADRGCQYDAENKMLNWFVGRLEKDQAAEIHVTLIAEKAGDFKHLIRATSEHGSLADAELPCTIEGISSLSLDVVDLDDPVELGTAAVYEIRVKNEGTAPAKQVELVCELAAGTSFVNATGPAKHAVDQQKVTFETTPEIGPGETAVFRVQVSSNESGSLRFRARISSESVTEPLTTDELTKFYGE